MALFQTSEIEDFSTPRVKEPSILEASTQGPVANLLAKSTETLSECWPVLTPGQHIHYATAGLWSSHDLLFHLLAQTGPARIWIATWSMTEEPVRMLVQGMESGLIEELQLLLDVRVQVRNPSVLAFAKMQASQVRTSICHAKVTVLENQAWAIAIVGSANYTNNPRIESGVVIENREVARFHARWIQDEIDHCKPFG